jgi:hypothetical protein
MSECEQHCPHFTGTGFSQGDFGGADEVQCCQCGEIRQIPYKVTYRAVAGHGDRFEKRGVLYEWPETWRPEDY